MVPALGAGSSISTLSVEISTTVSPSATESPTFTAHSRIVPSVTDSPPAGVTMSMISPPISAVPLPPLSAAAGAGASPDSISHSSWPTSIVSPSAAWTFTTVPAVGDGTSASTLSVEISTRTSSRSTGSPSFLCHSRTVPSVTDSPIAGMVTCTVVFTAIESLTLARCCGPLRTHEFVGPHERPDAADDDDGDGKTHRDDPAAGGVEARQRHGDPPQAVREAEDELQRVQPGDDPDREQREVDRRVGEGRPFQARKGDHANNAAMRRSGSPAHAGHSLGSPRPPPTGGRRAPPAAAPPPPP